MTRPSGIAVTTVRPKPSSISVSVTFECVQSNAESVTTRANTPPGPGSRYAGIRNSTTAAHHRPTMPTNVNGGSRFHATRRSARMRFDEPLVAAGTNARAESGACHSFGRARSLGGCEDVTGTRSRYCRTMPAGPTLNDDQCRNAIPSCANAASGMQRSEPRRASTRLPPDARQVVEDAIDLRSDAPELGAVDRRQPAENPLAFCRQLELHLAPALRNALAHHKPLWTRRSASPTALLVHRWKYKKNFGLGPPLGCQ